MSNDQPSPSRKQNFLSWLSSVKRNLPPALVASETPQLYYPVSTIVTRIMNCPEKVSTMEQFNHAVFFDLQDQASLAASIATSKNAAAAPSKNTFLMKFLSLNKGFVTSLINNGSTKTFRFLTQEKIQKGVENAITPYAAVYLNKKDIQNISAAVSGVQTGVIERLLFHFLDTWKILRQMNSPTISGLYNGLGIGVLRDGISAGAFFGSFFGFYNFLSSHQYPIPVPNKHKDTVDKLAGATAAGITTAIVTNPLTLVKTRMQSRGGSTAGIVSTIKKCYEKEGVDSIVNGNLIKDLGKVIHKDNANGIVGTIKGIVAHEGVSGLWKGTLGNAAPAPLRSSLPYLTFLGAKKKWDEYLDRSDETDKLCSQKNACFR